MANDNLLPFLLQNALNRAYPSGPASNQVLYQFSLENDTTTIPDTVTSTTRPIGYPYGWGESVTVNESANGTYTYNLTEPEGVAWLIKMSSYQPSGSNVTFNATVGTGSQQTLSPVSPAQVSWYADVYQWSIASSLGLVGMSPWNMPTHWKDSGAWWIGPDMNAASADAPGQWLVRKWIYCAAADTYTVYATADNVANVYIDGTYITQASGYSATTTGTISLSNGMHLVTVEMLNYGSAANPTGLLISIQDSLGNIVENGSSQQWETTGYINHAWSYGAGSPSFVDSWYMIISPSSTSVSASLILSGTPSPTVNNLWWHTVAPWRWNEGGQYNAAQNNTLPIVVTEVTDGKSTVVKSSYTDTMMGVIIPN